MPEIMYISPLFRAGEFQNTAQIEQDFRFLEPIREIRIPHGYTTAPLVPINFLNI